MKDKYLQGNMNLLEKNTVQNNQFLIKIVFGLKMKKKIYLLTRMKLNLKLRKKVMSMVGSQNGGITIKMLI